MATKWEDPDYEVVMAGGPLGAPPNYKFNLVRKNTTEDGYCYVVTPAGATPPAHPFNGIVLLPQEGKPLIHYLTKDKRLVSAATPAYATQLEDLIDEILHSKIDADADGFQRLVGVVALQGQPINLVTLYKVDNTHKLGELLVVTILRTIGAAPGGSIGIIGR